MSKLDAQSLKELKLELARRDFYEYCKLRIPEVYTPDRLFLKDLCERLQYFVYSSQKRFIVINMPPRFCKSLTGQLFTEWLFGKDKTNRVITGSYNETLASSFSKRVRDAIQVPRGQSEKLVFEDVFPSVQISKKNAMASMWSIEGMDVPSYLATSPGGMATGIGCNIMIIDDLIKNSYEAYSDQVKEEHANWFFNTLMQRTEGDWKIIIIMTRWATNDLAGVILDTFDCIHVDYKAYEMVKGKRVFLCPSILDAAAFDVKAKKMNEDIVLANYQQEAVDVKGRLYHDFEEYIPSDISLKNQQVFAVTDTADKGTDFLVCYVYTVIDEDAYILDAVISDSPMELTEVLVAECFDKWNVSVAFTEENNGGRQFARNVRRKMNNKKCVFIEEFQTSNKEARILNSSGWVQSNVKFPQGWKASWHVLYQQIKSYIRQGKNLHDDAVDALAYVYEMCTRQDQITQGDYEGERVYETVQSAYDDTPTMFW